MSLSLEEKYNRVKNDLEDLELYIKDFSSFLPLAICTISPLGMITDFNKSAEKLTGYLSFEIVGEFLESIFLEKDEIKNIKEGTADRVFYRKNLTLITKNGKNIPVNVSVSTRRDRRGNYIGYFLSISDISEIKSLQEELEKKVKNRTKELQERVNELERFHDLTVDRELKMLELKKEIKELKYADQKRGR